MKTPLASPRLAAALLTLVGSLAFAAQNPAPSDKIVDAYSKYVCFVMTEVSKGTAEDRRACEKDVSESLVQTYPRMTATQRMELEQMPAHWAQLQAEWAKLDEGQRDQLREQWAQMLLSQMDADSAAGEAEQNEP